MSSYAPGRIPYLYAICWTTLNTAYVGVRYGHGCHPDEFWKSYFTSSRYVAEFRTLHGEPDHIDIIDTFLTPNQAIAAEAEAIRDFSLHNDPGFLNMNLAGQPVWTDELKALVGRKARESADRKSQVVELNGEKVSLREIARRTSLPIGTLKRRHREGMTGADLTQPLGQDHKLFEYQGVKHSSVDLSRIAGISRQAITNRLKRMSIEQAVESPKA